MPHHPPIDVEHDRAPRRGDATASGQTLPARAAPVSGRRLRVLLVEDSPDDTALLLRVLRRGGYEPLCERVETAAQMQAALARPWDVVIADYVLPHFSGLDAVRLLRGQGNDLPFILISGAVGEEIAVEAMKAGAHDFVAKGNPVRLVPAIERELRDAADRRERRRLEEQLQQAQRLETAGHVASAVAHEFNNQLTVIKSCVQFLLAALPADDPRRQDAQRIASTVDRGARLAQQLLAFSREQPLALHSLNVSDVVQELLPMLHPLVRGTATLHSHLAADLPAVRADHQQLELVLINLVLNARDALAAAPDGGAREVVIDTTTVHVEASRAAALSGRRGAAAHVLLSVRDTGIGMRPEVRARIFEPFFTTKAPGKGTGLGLSTAFGIVKQHGGWIECDSAPAAGTTFRVYLPVADPSAAPAPTAAPARHAQRV